LGDQFLSARARRAHTAKEGNPEERLQSEERKSREAKRDERGSKEGAKQRKTAFSFQFGSVNDVIEGAPTKTPITQPPNKEKRRTER
jgi:hypothetical protein